MSQFLSHFHTEKRSELQLSAKNIQILDQVVLSYNNKHTKSFEYVTRCV